jgi:pimeloyl-ACP methyl ester carboxylesterase
MTPDALRRLRNTVARVAIGLILIGLADAFGMTAGLNALDAAPADNDKSSAVGILGPVEGEKSSPDSEATTSEREDFHPVGAPRTFASAPGVVESTFEMSRGPSPFDRIGLHRLTQTPPPSNSGRALEHAQQTVPGREPITELRAQASPQMNHPQSSRRAGIVMLYLPGTNMNGVVAVDDPRYSLPLFMATHGVDFWALDYRTHFIPPTTPTSDLTELKGWTNDLFESDILLAAEFVRHATGHRKIFIAGFSRGAAFAYLFASRHWHEVKGLVILDGFIPTDRVDVKPPPGRYADDVAGAHLTYDKRKALMEAVIANPSGPAPLPKYKTARENLEAVVYGAGGIFGGHGGLANPGGGYSDAVVLARMLVDYDRYWPTVQDYENPFTPDDLARLAATKIPVIAFSSTNIGPQWPARVTKSASSTGSTDVTVKTLPGWGHLDVICGTHSEAEVFIPALSFLKANASAIRTLTPAATSQMPAASASPQPVTPPH